MRVSAAARATTVSFHCQVIIAWSSCSRVKTTTLRLLLGDYCTGHAGPPALVCVLVKSNYAGPRAFFIAMEYAALPDALRANLSTANRPPWPSMSSWEYRARTRWTRRIALERVAGGTGQEQRHLKRRGAVGAVYTDALGRVDAAHDMDLSRAVGNAAAFAEGGGRVSSCRTNHWDTVTPPRNVRIEGVAFLVLRGNGSFSA